MRNLVSVKNIIFCFIISLSFPYLNLAQTVTFNEEFQVNSNTENQLHDPCMAELSNNNIVICWTSYDQPGNSDIHAQIFNENLEKIGAEFQINTYAENEQSTPAITSTPDGFVITWQSWDPDSIRFTINAQIFNNEGQKDGNEFQVSEDFGGNQLNPCITALANDEFIICWQGESGNATQSNPSDIFAQRYNVNGEAIGSQFLVNSYSLASQTEPAVVKLNNGFVISWSSDQSSGLYKIYAQLYDDHGEPKGPYFEVSPYYYENHHSHNSNIINLDENKFIIIWQGQTGLNHAMFNIRAQKFDITGNKIGDEFQINTFPNVSKINPVVARFSSEHIIVAWEVTPYNYNGSRIQGQILDNNGNKNLEELGINPFTSWSQKQPAVGSLSGDRFLVAWESNEQDNGKRGIIAKYLSGPRILPLSEFYLNTLETDTAKYNVTFELSWESASDKEIFYLSEIEYGGVLLITLSLAVHPNTQQMKHPIHCLSKKAVTTTGTFWQRI